MELLDVKFKNLKIGYYFIFEEKAFCKINDFSAIQLYSSLDAPLFTKTNSRYMNVNKELEYSRPARVPCTFEPDEMIKFVKKENLRDYISDKYLSQRNIIKFNELEIGTFYKSMVDDKYYKKISYDKSIPIYENKIGLSESENVSITSISSAEVLRKSYNRILYNGDLLIELEPNSWNIVWFEDDFTKFYHSTFQTSINWSIDSKSLLNYIDSIPDEKLVFIFNSNDILRGKDINTEDSELKTITDLVLENENSLNIMEKVGITLNILENIGMRDSFLLVCIKNKEILYYKKLISDPIKNLYHSRNDLSYKLIDYTYTYNTYNKTIETGFHKKEDLNSDVIKISREEINVKFLYNLDNNNKKILSSYGIYDF